MEACYYFEHLEYRFFDDQAFEIVAFNLGSQTKGVLVDR